MTKSLYSILNVAPDADPEVIEAAYKALMKKYHPDRLVGEADSGQRRASEINRAFQVLRDPERRAEYDSREQARQDAMRMAMPGSDMRPMHFQAPPAKKRSKWSALLLIAILAGLTYYVWHLNGGVSGSQFTSTDQRQAGAAAAGRADPRRLPPVRQKDIDRAILESRLVNQKTGLMGLSGYSQDCFASQSRSASVADLDFCVAFDSAALSYDSESARVYSLPELPRFQAREMMSRHLNAAKLVSDDDEWILTRLAQVRALTDQRLNGSSSALALPVPTNVKWPVARAEASTPRAQPRTRPPPPARARTAGQRQRPRPSDREFMERQGYIY